MINNVCLSGQLVAPAKTVSKDNVVFMVATIVIDINQQKKYINLLVFDEHIQKICEKYFIDANKGKKLCACGKVSFDKLDNMQIVTYDISFLDKFIDSKTVEENKVVFDDETP